MKTVKPIETPTDLQTGLTAEQVKQRVEQGQTNVQLKKLSRSIPQILSDNFFTLFNILNFAIAIVIFWTGAYKNLFFLGPVLINLIIGSYQEIRSKLTVDKISLVNESKLTVIRDSQLQTVPIDQLVADDLVLLKRGNTVPADGIVRTTVGLQTDESSLTGEADSVSKEVGAAAYSGSFVIAGQGYIQLTQVGHASFVAQLSNAVSQDKPDLSVLMRIINRIIKVLTYTIIPVGLALFFRSYLRNGDLTKAILGTSASVIGMIPEGLVVLTSIALATGAYKLSQRHILVRSLNAIETLARVETLCLDKTGTITTGQLTVKQVVPFAQSTEQVNAIATLIVQATKETNATANAIVALGKKALVATVQEVIAFSSERKYSGVVTANQKYLMGAPEFILAEVNAEQQTAIDQATNAGYRVLAVVTEVSGQRQLAGLILIADQVRKQAKDTFAYLRNQGLQLKIISGDNPVTVVNVAKQAGIEGSERYLDLSQVGDDPDYRQLVQNYQVFGRVKPQQKAELIKAMQANGQCVGMTGDGVNDVLAMRQSDCSIAMAGESDAAEATANFVLLDHNFDSMIDMLNEGRRVINNVERVASMYLIKTIYSVVLSVLFIILGTGYPFQLSQMTPINILTVGIPTFFLALEPNYTPPAGRFMRNVMEIALPAALCDILLLVGINVLDRWQNYSFATTSTLSVFTIGLIGFCALVSISNPLTTGKKVMIGLLFSFFILTFFFATNIFALQSIWPLNWWYSWLYLALLVTSWPLFLFMREMLGRRVFSRIKWR
ncbi:MAG: HAD-IC family P-type ATPase [Lactobacillaceae bacterium]|jgi:cation-transporting ATPase E|nr:HAD-IC family P-type ATPase [Lactobacillaceae bacterium]